MTGPGGRVSKHSPGESPVTGPGGRVRNLGRRIGAVAVLAAGLVTLGSPAPAEAAPVITIDQPRLNAVLSSATVTVSGTAEVDATLGSTLSTLETVTLTVGSTTIEAACSGKRTCSFQETFSLPLNGPSSVEVFVRQSGLITGGESRDSRRFAVEAPPAKPVLDPPKVTDARTVELSWSRNTEADMLSYAVFRKDPGASGLNQVGGEVPQPKTGSKVTFTDTGVNASTGGDYAYQVVAVRKGRTGAARPAATSESALRTASVPAPATGSSTTVAPVPGSPTAGPSTTTKPGPPAGIDLSGFLSSRSQPAALPAITVPEPPDTGFSGNLPFGARPPGEELEEGEAEAVPPPTRRTPGVVSAVDTRRPLVPVAAGLVLMLLAMHLRLLNRRVAPVGAADLPVEPLSPAPVRQPVKPLDAKRPVPRRRPQPVAQTVAVAEPSAQAVPERRPEPRPAADRTAFYDVEQEPDEAPAVDHREAEPVPEPEPQGWRYEVDDEADWAPASEPEPEPIQALEPEPEPVYDREPEPEAEPEPEPEPVYDREPEPVHVVDPDPDPEPEPEPEVPVASVWAPEAPQDTRPEAPDPDDVDPEEIEVFEVVSPPRRRLARAGGR